MSQKQTASVYVDYQNLYHKAREYGHDFHIVPYINFLREKYGVRHNNIHIFMHATFLRDMHIKAKRYVEKTGLIHTASRERNLVDPVDIKMEREIRSGIRQRGIDVIIVGSSDKIFADLGTLAWKWNKEFHVYTYADPARRYEAHTPVVCSLLNNLSFEPFVRL